MSGAADEAAELFWASLEGHYVDLTIDPFQDPFTRLVTALCLNNNKQKL